MSLLAYLSEINSMFAYSMYRLAITTVNNSYWKLYS